MMNDDTTSGLLSHWPGGWPGQNVVELDNLGDPGIWLRERLELIAEALRGDDAEIQETAGMLADDYIAAASEMSFPLPSNFDASDAECSALIESDFRAFLIEWRRRIKSANPK